jgi:hypothetical protein
MQTYENTPLRISFMPCNVWAMTLCDMPLGDVGDKKNVVLERGLFSDGFSCPDIAEPLVSPKWGRFGKAGVGHDGLYETRVVSQEAADRWLYLKLLDQIGPAPVRSWNPKTWITWLRWRWDLRAVEGTYKALRAFGDFAYGKRDNDMCTQKDCANFPSCLKRQQLIKQNNYTPREYAVSQTVPEDRAKGYAT